MASQCDCRYERLSGSRQLVIVRGDLDVHSCPQFGKALGVAARSDAAHLLVDLSDVTFMDSSAVGILAAEQRRRPEPLHVVVKERQLLRVLEVTGYSRVFALHASLDAALLETGRLQAQRVRPL